VDPFLSNFGWITHTKRLRVVAEFLLELVDGREEESETQEDGR
jgi:hypothetical protein